MDSWDPLSCRACLTSDVKSFQLHDDTGLADLFGLIVGSPVLPADGLPQSVCFYCCAQLTTLERFRKKCQKSMAIFRETGPAVSTYTNCFEENKYYIPLSRTVTVLLDYLPETEENVAENEFYDIKSESDFADGDNRQDADEYDKPCDIKDELTIEEVEIKSEIVAAEPTNILVEDKPIPLDPNKAAKAKNVKARRTKRKTETGAKKKREPKPKKKKCNRYNEKFEEDFVEFCNKYNVKVVCLSKEEQIRKVLERRESASYRHSLFACDVCFKWFMSENAHTRHMKRHEPSSGTFVCEICQLRFPSKYILNNHARSHKKNFICSLCGQENFCFTRAKLHAEWHKGIKFKCKICDKEFNANSTYLNHKRESHKSVSCADCGASFQGTNELHKHTDSVHGNMKFKCSICSVDFQSAEARDRHGVGNVCLGKTHPCRHCGANFSFKSGLHQHIADEHAAVRDMFTCEQCGAIFTSDRYLTAHFNYKHIKRVNKQESSRHARLVGRQPKSARTQLKKTTNNPDEKQELPYLCEICAKSFTCPAKLKTHLQGHSDKKPFPCPMCPKSFKTKSAREIHINVHTGDRPYKCLLCPETFKSYAQRYKHKLLVHTGERRHKCTLCEKSYVVGFDLKEHVRYAHLHEPRRPRRTPRGKAPASRPRDNT